MNKAWLRWILTGPCFHACNEVVHFWILILNCSFRMLNVVIFHILPKHKKRMCVPVVCKSFYFARNGLRAEYRHPLSCHVKIMCGTGYILETHIYLIQCAMKFTSFKWITQNAALFWLLTRFREFAIYFKMASGAKLTS